MGDEKKSTYNFAGIYAIIHIASNRLYVGSSKDIERRWQQHRYRLNKNMHHSRYLQHMWTKYGEASFAFTLLEFCQLEHLLKREQYWIDYLKPVFNTLQIAGSPLGYKASDSSRQKMSESRKGRKLSLETKEKISKTMKGKTCGCKQKRKPMSAETKRKISVKRTGYKHSDEAKRKVSEARRKLTS